MKKQKLLQDQLSTSILFSREYKLYDKCPFSTNIPLGQI